MVDIRTVQTANFPAIAITLDWSLLPNGTLDNTDDLATAVYIAFCSNRLALPDDDLPDINSSDHNGWWADADAEEIWGAWPIGSRLWLLARGKITDAGSKDGATVIRVQDYMHEALMPFVQNRIISNFTLDVERNAYDRNRIDAFVALYRGNNPPIALQFQVLWTAMGLVISLVP
jgi:phage gp46-like protein